MNKKTKIVLVAFVVMLCFLTLGAQSCEKQDVITGMVIANSTLNSLYNGTAVPLITDYCKNPPPERAQQCEDFAENINPAMQEFLTVTFPSMIEIAKMIIPEDQEPIEPVVVDEKITQYLIDEFSQLPLQKQKEIISMLEQTSKNSKVR